MSLTQDWRLKAQRYTLKGSFTKDTNQLVFPPRPVASRPTPVIVFQGSPQPLEDYSVKHR